MKSDRLLALLLLLQARSPRPATELSERLEVSVRTIYRDAEALSSAGVPVYAERGRSGGIALLPGYRTQVPGLSGDEAAALFVLMTGTAHTDLGFGPSIGGALRKLLASLPGTQQDTAELIRERILVDPARWRAHDTRPEHLGTVQTAVLDTRRLRLHYRKSQGAEGTYTVDPLGLVHKAGVWHLIARHRQVTKNFRVDRVLDATVLDSNAHRPAGFDLQTTWHELQRDFSGSMRAVAVRVRVRRRILGRVLRMHGQETTVDAGDDEDWVGTTLRFPALEAARALLAHGDDLEILDPPELRDRFADLGHRIAAMYS
ncbi:helix-turn-helix transcriptional regulator [Kineosporia succinea]|uniref:DNA-binding transcriptional regulator YafY n=1 Tax=Kineosporia succinea TaxID=84632 RepID=A0ABT9PD18_9ACTN|nr:WYL domain-containing protein [Kineosporia succinea]MDP9830603.1 putative DNA-binding transcriptional regulator YafY [Kineosporia succinea]